MQKLTRGSTFEQRLDSKWGWERERNDHRYVTNVLFFKRWKREKKYIWPVLNKCVGGSDGHWDIPHSADGLATGCSRRGISDGVLLIWPLGGAVWSFSPMRKDHSEYWIPTLNTKCYRILISQAATYWHGVLFPFLPNEHIYGQYFIPFRGL